MTESGGHQYLKSHDLSGDVLQFDLVEEQRQVLALAAATATGHTAKTLIKDGPLRVVLLGLKKGASMREHKAEGPVTIQTLQGSARVLSGEQTEELPVGNMLVFGGGVTHSVEAQADSVLLLTIAMTS